MSSNCRFHVGSAILNQTALDWDGNASRILSAIQIAKSTGVNLLCLPELCISGYGCEDAFWLSEVQNNAIAKLLILSKETEGIAVCFGLPLCHGRSLYNVMAFVVNGKIMGFVPKRHLANAGVHYEHRWFSPWPRDIVDHWTCIDKQFQIPLSQIPMGDLVFELHGKVYCDYPAYSGIRIGFEICEDAWGARRNGVDLVEREVDIICNPSASHFAFGKHKIRKRFVLEGSRAFGVTYIYSNLCGNEAGRLIYDGGALIASGGKMLAVGPRFTYRDVHVTKAVIDVMKVRRSRLGATIRESATRNNTNIIKCNCDTLCHPHSIERLDNVACDTSWENSSFIKEEEFTRAACLGLFDYLRKTSSSGFVLSLSGGADSATIAILVRFMLELVLQELGKQDTLIKLGVASNLSENLNQESVFNLQNADIARELVNRLLLCVYQSTKNSSEKTLESARMIAREIGAEFLYLDIDPLVEQYKSLVSTAINRPLTWETDDLTLQNIQARARSPSVWMLANLRRALLLATSNRSEIAVGYATMDGDTAGSLAPLAGIDKEFIRHWLRWVERDGPIGIFPISAVKLVNDQVPTAELRPPERLQSDESDLMPYSILNEIEKYFVRDKLAEAEILDKLVTTHSAQYSRNTLSLWIQKFFHLWHKNQWKRERYAPGFHYDDRNLDSRTWCRFPILNHYTIPHKENAQ